MLGETDTGKGCAQRGGRVGREVGVSVSSPKDTVSCLGLEARLCVGLSVERVWENDILPVMRQKGKEGNEASET
jgi:hypothetical protein